MRKIFFIFCSFPLFSLICAAQNVPDSISKHKATFRIAPLIIPTLLVVYGAIGVRNDQLLSFNEQIRAELTENIDEKITIDDFSQWVPATSVYALDLAGVQGKNNIRDQTVIMATSFILMSTTVIALKSMVKEVRPDGSSNNSFPSGHTATAFAGAEFLWQEYKERSIWIGIGGYVVAGGTGIFRMYNNRHWLTDVAAGAGIGILSTKAAYLLNPLLKKHFSGTSKKKAEKTMTLLIPGYDGRNTTIALVRTF